MGVVGRLRATNPPHGGGWGWGGGGGGGGGADRIIVSPDEGRTGSDLTPEVRGDHLCGATAVGAINQNTSLAEIKAVIRVVIIVLVNTVPENETLCESWIGLFVVFAALQRGPSFCEKRREGLCAPVNCLLVSALHLFCLCWKKLEALKEWVSSVSWGLHSPSPRLREFSQTSQWECV